MYITEIFGYFKLYRDYRQPFFNSIFPFSLSFSYCGSLYTDDTTFAYDSVPRFQCASVRSLRVTSDPYYENGWSAQRIPKCIRTLFRIDFSPYADVPECCLLYLCLYCYIQYYDGSVASSVIQTLESYVHEFASMISIAIVRSPAVECAVCWCAVCWLFLGGFVQLSRSEILIRTPSVSSQRASVEKRSDRGKKTDTHTAIEKQNI